jgi:hypothetical protein
LGFESREYSAGRGICRHLPGAAAAGEKPLAFFLALAGFAEDDVEFADEDLAFLGILGRSEFDDQRRAFGRWSVEQDLVGVIKLFAVEVKLRRELVVAETFDGEMDVWRAVPAGSGRIGAGFDGEKLIIAFVV